MLDDGLNIATVHPTYTPPRADSFFSRLLGIMPTHQLPSQMEHSILGWSTSLEAQDRPLLDSRSVVCLTGKDQAHLAVRSRFLRSLASLEIGHPEVPSRPSFPGAFYIEAW